MTPTRHIFVLVACLALMGTRLHAASGLDCANAIPSTADAQGSAQAHVMQGRTLWFSFNAQFPQVRITAEGPDYSSWGGHIHGMRLYGGTCGGLVLLAERELAWAPTQSRLQIDLEAGLLVPGQDYYVELLRDPASGNCPKSACGASASVPVELSLRGYVLLLPPDPVEPVQSLAFEENRGQLLGSDGQPAPEVAFYNLSGQPRAYAMSDRLGLVWSRHDTTPAHLGGLDEVHRIDMRLVDAAPSAWLKSEPIPGHSNYYLGHIPDGVARNHAYARLVMPQVYPGIDCQLYSDAAGLKLYFVVAPQTEAGQVELAFDGADQVLVRPDGGLEVRSSLGAMVWAPAELTLYDPQTGVQALGQARFVDHGGSYGLDMPGYSSQSLLVISLHGYPPVLAPAAALPAWGTFYGGAEGDACLGMDTDELGNVYAAGETYSWDFPVSIQYQQAPFGNRDAYVSRFNEYYVRGFTNWIGGNELDGAAEVDVDAVSGRVYICGNSYVGVAPMQPNSGVPGYYLQAYPFGTNSGFLAGFERMGGAREWVTKFGGDQSLAMALETDLTGDIYLVGATYETKLKPTSQPTAGLGFPITAAPGAFIQNMTNLSPNGNPEGDAFIARFSRHGVLEWSTILGGNRNDAFYDVAIDNFYGHVYAVGGWKSQPLGGSNGNLMPCAYAPLVPAGGYHQNLLDGQAAATNNPGDGLIVRFSLGGALQWSTLYGGSGWDGISSVVVEGQALGVVPTGTVYLAGFTGTTSYGTNCASPTSGGFPGCASDTRYHQPYGGGADDAFIARFERNTQLAWATCLGGGGRDGYKLSGNCPGPKVAAGAGDHIFVAGSTSSGTAGLAPLPTQPNGSFYEQLSHADAASTTPAYDGYILGFNWQDQLDYGSYLGGQGGDFNQANAANYDKVFAGGAVIGQAGYPLYNPVALPGTAWFQGYPVSGGEGHYAQILTSLPMANDAPLAVPSTLLLSPNPTTGRLEVQAPWAGMADMEVLDALGHLLLRRTATLEIGTKSALDLADLPAGLYLLRCIHPDGVATGKFVKQ